jgi:hypothetical protein
MQVRAATQSREYHGTNDHRGWSSFSLWLGERDNRGRLDDRFVRYRGRMFGAAQLGNLVPDKLSIGPTWKLPQVKFQLRGIVAVLN